MCVSGSSIDHFPLTGLSSLTHHSALQMEELESVYQAAASRVDAYLMDLMRVKYTYRSYFSAFKRYLLLSQVSRRSL